MTSYGAALTNQETGVVVLGLGPGGEERPSGWPGPGARSSRWKTGWPAASARTGAASRPS